jgi:anti-anti-sigma factor
MGLSLLFVRAEAPMPLQISCKTRQTIEVIYLHGSLTFGAEDLAFRQEVDRCVAAGKVRLVIDLKELTQLDSCGCSTVLDTEQRLTALGGGVVLVNLIPDRLDPLEVERLKTVFEPFDLEQEAVNSYFSLPRVKHYDILDVVRPLIPRSHDDV